MFGTFFCITLYVESVTSFCSTSEVKGTMKLFIILQLFIAQIFGECLNGGGGMKEHLPYRVLNKSLTPYLSKTISPAFLKFFDTYKVLPTFTFDTY